MVELRDVSLSYPLPHRERAVAIRGVNARFERGSLSAIIGPSGCGKSTIIKIISGLVTPDEGTVLVAGSPLTGIRKQTAVIFQDFGLFPWKTVLANAELPLLINGDKKSSGQRRQKVKSLLQEFGLADYSRRYPRELSGGMKQRLAIVRALAAEPELLLMDEPFSSLDAFTREDAQDFLLSVQQEHRLTIIMITHSIEEAVYLADTVYVMGGVSPGTITQCIPISRSGGLSRASYRTDEYFQKYSGVLRQAMKPGQGV